MNIKQHIEAGHYPKDEKGRALVPMKAASGEWIAIIYATDYPGRWPILGRSAKRNESDKATAPMQWTERGEGSGSMHEDWFLLPPPPRKVEVKRYLVVAPKNEYGPYLYEAEATGVACARGGRVVSLTGSYEEPW